MGWFQFLRDRKSEKAAARREAERAASEGNWLDAAWAQVDDHAFVASLYEKRAKVDDDVAEARQRALSASHEPEAVRVLLEEGGGETIAPLMLSMLHTDSARHAMGVIAAGVDLGRPIAPYLNPLPEQWRLVALASSPYESDRTLVFDAIEQGLDEDDRRHIAIRLGNADDARVDDLLRAIIREDAAKIENRFQLQLEDEEIELADAGFWMAVGKRAPEGAAPDLVRLLRSDCAPYVLYALGSFDDASIADDLERYLASIVGTPKECCVLRIGAQNALARLGRPQPLDDARHARDVLHYERYGYPDWDDLAVLLRLAAEAFADRGNDEDRDWVRSLATAPQQILRVVAQRFVSGPWVYWDSARVERVLDEQGPAALLDALDDPRAIFRYKIVEKLAEVAKKDPELRRDLAWWCRHDLERVRNFYTQYAGDVGPAQEASMDMLRDLEKAERAELLTGTTSDWIQIHLLDEGDMERPLSPTPVPDDVSIEGFDLAPWSFGKNINGLGVSPDGSTIAIVGEEISRLVDARTGLTKGQIELRWRWGYDIAFSPDGSRIAACFHGGHVEIYDGVGERIHELKGHGGVPTGTRCLAWSADGKTLVTGGGDGTLIAWNTNTGKKRWSHSGGPGNYQDVVFVPDGRVLASHVKTSGGEENFLELLDPKTGNAERHDTKTSMWALAVRDDGLVAMAGEGKYIFLSKNGVASGFRTWRRLEQRKVTQLRFVGDLLWAAGEDGELRCWDIETRKAATSFTAEGPLWAVDTCHDRTFAVGKKGRIHVFEGGRRLEVPGESHGRRVVAMVPMGDEVVTADWDGKILRFPRSGGEGTLVTDLDLTIESAARVSEDSILFGTRDGLRLVSISTGEVTASTEERSDDVAIDGDMVGHGDDESLHRSRLPGLEREGEPVVVGTDDINAIATAPGGGFITGTEDGQVCLVRDGKRVWGKADHGADRLRTGDPHCNVASIAVAPDGSCFASAATDHKVRIYEWPSTELRLRISCGFGLFNRIAFSPDAKLLAIPSSWKLQVFDVQSGDEVWAIGAKEGFETNELAGVIFLGDRTLLVGCDSGRLFRVELGGDR